MSIERTPEDREQFKRDMERLSAKSYRVFTRTWWRRNSAWPGGREPGAGRKSYEGHPRHLTYEEAQRYCKAWNAEHEPGFLSRKAEFEEE